MKARFTEGIARFNIAVGIVVMLIGVALAVYAFTLPDRPLPFGPPILLSRADAFIALLLGIMLGSILIETGDLIFVSLELRRRVARIDRTLRRLADRDRDEVESGLVNRLRPR